MKSSPNQHIHLIGICGTAMATLAAMLKERAYRVSGSDQNVYPPMSLFLQEHGIPVASPFSKENLIPKPDLVVVGNAISRGNVELEATLNERIPFTSSAELMKEAFVQGKHSVVVTGTHGKTTTTSLVAWILTCAGLDPTFMAGGIAQNFQSSFRLGSGEIFVGEGDEYDTAFFDKTPKFLHYLPTSVIINNIEFDHADIYASLDEIEQQFRRLVNLIPENGLLLAGAESETVVRVAQKAFCTVQTFGIGDFFWSARRLDLVPGPAGTAAGGAGGGSFDVQREGETVARVSAPLAGQHNVRNMVAAFALASNLGVPAQAIADALGRFAGVKRRLELLGIFGGVFLFDDFAHHPTAVRETLAGLRSQHPDLPLYVAFEPRSATSRRKVFQDDFAHSLSLADTVLVSALFDPSKIEENERLDPLRVAAHLRQLGRAAEVFRSSDEIVEYLGRHVSPPAVLVVMSNGGFGGINPKLCDMLSRKFGPAAKPTEATGLRNQP
ncbi:MAG: UDP-N-acetylmuramate:L-alanyl-gamma-D-glutamyl-meso-diaminopimelate ligase [Acidobacteria bacterium]|nr:UDP-N-acetylmuramate:L-alanyl-gamma-D-glutamyl-meso-diaminopimelate ligase [Acidobacteriota bacterium]